MAKNALDIAGPWKRKDNFPLKPVGCFTDPSGDLYLNSNPKGPAKEGHVPICEKVGSSSSSDQQSAPSNQGFRDSSKNRQQSSSSNQDFGDSSRIIADSSQSLESMARDVAKAHAVASAAIADSVLNSGAYSSEDYASAVAQQQQQQLQQQQQQQPQQQMQQQQQQQQLQQQLQQQVQFQRQLQQQGQYAAQPSQYSARQVQDGVGGASLSERARQVLAASRADPRLTYAP
jgi:hypothetical protein